MPDANLNGNRSGAVDAGTKWTPVGDWRDARIFRTDWSARAVLGLGQILVSGDLRRAKETVAPNSTEVGLWQQCDTLPVFIRIGRDRALVVTDRPLRLSPGWCADGWAVSPHDDAYRALEISGDGIPELIAEATSTNVGGRSPSASVLFAGVGCLLYRSGPNVARLHVESPVAPYLWQWLETR
jgi:hypothetical protein